MESHEYETERELIEEAVKDIEAREDLRIYVEPYVRDAIREYLPKWEAPLEAEDYLVIAGMTPFDQALKLYVAHSEFDDKPDGYFPLYFIWWARRSAFSTYCKIASRAAQ